MTSLHVQDVREEAYYSIVKRRVKIIIQNLSQPCYYSQLRKASPKNSFELS